MTAQALRLAGRCTLVSFGYVIAVFVATTVALLCMALPDLFGRSSPQRIMQFFGDTFVAGLMVTFLTALPGFLIAICFAIVYRWKVWAAYAAAGTANGAFALALFGTYLVGKMWPDPHVLLASLAGGFVGGFSFWAAGGRYAGFWRGKAEL